MVTDFHYLNIWDTKSAGWEWKDSLFKLMTRSKWGLVTFLPLGKTHLYSKNGVIRSGLVCVPFNKTQLLSLKLMSGQDHMETCLYFEVYTQGCKWMQVSFPLACNTQSIIMEKTHKFTFYTLITLWMLCTIVLNLRPAFVMLDPIYINM